MAEDAVERFQDTGSAVRSLTVTAKSKICFKNEPICNPEHCEYARDHYTKVHAEGLLEKLSKKKKLSAKQFRKLGEEFEVCPFELQLDAARDADVVICDYNYVFAPHSAFGRLASTTIGQEGKPNLVIDEAHNLPSRAMDYYSPSLSSYSLEFMRKRLEDIPSRFRQEASLLIDDCIQTIIECRPENLDPKGSVIDPPSHPFMDQEEKLRGFLSRYLESDVEGVLEHLRERSMPTMMFAVQGGVFSEGVDYPGEMIIGAFVVGPPLPSFDLERERMRRYYEEHYKAGFDYAYAFPAMAKAVQAAGRVIRSETDRGIIVLLDGRFIQSSYSKSMPADWFERAPTELVSRGICLLYTSDAADE